MSSFFYTIKSFFKISSVLFISVVLMADDSIVDLSARGRENLARKLVGTYTSGSIIVTFDVDEDGIGSLDYLKDFSDMSFSLGKPFDFSGELLPPSWEPDGSRVGVHSVETVHEIGINKIVQITTSMDTFKTKRVVETFNLEVDLQENLKISQVRKYQKRKFGLVGPWIADMDDVVFFDGLYEKVDNEAIDLKRVAKDNNEAGFDLSYKITGVDPGDEPSTIGELAEQGRIEEVISLNGLSIAVPTETSFARREDTATNDDVVFLNPHLRRQGPTPSRRVNQQVPSSTGNHDNSDVVITNVPFGKIRKCQTILK